jgi:glycine betaine/proline transport system substrate-binding protein
LRHKTSERHTKKAQLVFRRCPHIGPRVAVAAILIAASLAVARDGHAADMAIGYFNNYLPAELEANVIAVIVANHPALGVGSVRLVGTDVTPAWVGIRRGDTDVMVEVALPNQQPLLDKSAGIVVTVSQIYGDAREGFFVPRYLVEGAGAPAPGLKRVDQLARYKELFDGKFYDESPGWQSTKLNSMRLQAYGIDFTHLELSDAALIATIVRAEERKQPIVFFFYHPHWLFKRFDLVKLEEPNPYHAGCFENGVGQCAVPSFSAWVAARKDLAARAPRFYALLSHFTIPIDDVEDMMLKVNTEKRSAHEVATLWVEAHHAEVDRWLNLAAGH